MAEMHRPENIPGYIPPESLKYERSGVYKVFNADDEDVTEFGTTSVAKQYSILQSDTLVDTENCPTCNTPAVKICDCVYNDKVCKNQHNWYNNRDGKVVRGYPHKM